MIDSIPDPVKCLPHGDGFRFVSEVTAYDPGQSAQGVWRTRGDEAFFEAHFPGQPLIPGVLLIEALAQISGILVFTQNTGQGQAGLAQSNIRFTLPVAPPAEVILHTSLTRQLGQLYQFDVEAIHQNKTVAKGELTLAQAIGRT